MDYGKDLFALASMFISVALVALLVGHASQSSQLIQTTGKTFGDLLNIVELNNSGGVNDIGIGSF